MEINYIEQDNEFTSFIQLIRTNLYMARNKIDYDKTLGILIIGEIGVGKTYMVHEMAKLFNVKLLRDNATSRTNRIDLEGYYYSENGEIVFKKGKMVLAIEEANRNGFCIYLINEINAIPENEQVGFSEILDFQAELNLACKSDEQYKIDEGCFLLIIGTMNVDVTGVNRLQKAFDIRFPFQKTLDYPEENIELDIIEYFTNERPVDLVHVSNLIRASKKELKLSKALGTRELIRIVRYCKTDPSMIENIINMSIVDKLSNDFKERELVKSHIQTKELVKSLSMMGKK